MCSFLINFDNAFKRFYTIGYVSMNKLLKKILQLCLLFRYCTSFTGELFPFQRHNDCKIQEYYSVNTLTCKQCQKEKFLVPTEDSMLLENTNCCTNTRDALIDIKFFIGLSCSCNNQTKVVRWEGEFPYCIPCKENEEPTSDQEECIACPLDNSNKSKCSQNKMVCLQDEIYGRDGIILLRYLNHS